MRFYVAGKFEDKERIERLMEKLRNQGHEITHDWTRYDHSEDVYEMRCRAKDNIQGVKQADVLIMVLIDDLQYTGTFVEMGIAIAEKKPIIIIGNQRNDNIFTKLPNVVRINELN